MDAIVVGIDVSKDKLDIAVLPQGETFTTSRDAKGPAHLIARIKPLLPQAVAVEATGGFETLVAARLAADGLPVVVVNPAQVRAFAKALGQRAKTDPIDALVIARFVLATKPEIRPLPDEATRFLNDLVSRRRQIINMIVAEKQREKRLSNKRLQQSIARLVKALEKELASLDKDIDVAVRGSPPESAEGRREKEDLLVSGPRIGQGSAMARRVPCSPLFQSSARSAPDRPDRSSVRAFHPPIRPLERQELHRRRQARSPQRPLHGGHGGGAPQPADEELLRAAPCRRQAENGRLDRSRP